MQRSTWSRSRRGFTLIELLVVIAIIAILAAILFPVFAQAREKARAASCVNNLKQFTMAFSMYKSDNDETYPYWNWGVNSKNGSDARKDHYESLWMNSLFPYVKSAGVYACPSDRFDITPANSLLSGWMSDGMTPTQMVDHGMDPALVNAPYSYAANEHLLNGGFGTPKDAIVDKPANTMIIADGVTPLFCCLSQWRPDRNNPGDIRHHFIVRRVAYPNQCDGTWWGGDQTVALPAWDDAICTRHTAGSNIGFADSHVKWMRDQRITDDLYLGDQSGG